MTLANTQSRYGLVTQVFHWLTAPLILANIALGLLANRWPLAPETAALKFQLFSAHKTLGVAIFLISLARIAWGLWQIRPAPLAGHRRFEVLLSDIMYWLIYGALVLVPLSGWLEHAATQGYAPILWPFGQDLPLVPKSPELALFFAAAHYVFARVLIVAILFHIAGAAKHALLDRDQTLARMLGRPGPAIALSAAGRPRLGRALAALIWALAIALAASLGAAGFRAVQSPAPAPASETSIPRWIVQPGGTLAIEVLQFGHPVQGRFESWQAEITFDPGRDTLEQGTIEARIDILSLQMGDLTDQAMGPDYFDAPAFPQAIYRGSILPDGQGGYLIDGTLQIKDAEVPLPMLAQIEVDGTTAQATAVATIDRRDAMIGPTITNPGVLGFEVNLTLQMTARRDPG